MDEKEQLSAFHSALTTEHFVLQTASSSTVSESAARASIYIMSLSTSVVAMDSRLNPGMPSVHSPLQFYRLYLFLAFSPSLVSWT